MQILKDDPNIKIINEDTSFIITTIQKYDEDETEIIIQCAEYIPVFKKGFVCDMEITFNIVDTDDYNKIIGAQDYINKNLVLVHIKKLIIFHEYIPRFEYVFYK